jgi:hypothetical protein
MEAAVALSADGRSRRGEPSDTSCRAWNQKSQNGRSRAVSIRRARFNRGTSMQPTFPSAKVPSAGEVLCTRALASNSFTGAPLPLANGGSRRTCSSRFEKASKTSTRPLGNRCRGSFVGRMRFYDFCK